MKNKRHINRSGFLAAGSWGVDHVKQILAYPASERSAAILRDQESPGGCAYNVLVDLAQLKPGFPLWGAGLLGKDPGSARILEDCSAWHIDTHYLRTVAGVRTPFTDVMTERGSGRRTFFHYRGAGAQWTGEDLDFHKIKARILHLGYLLSLDALDAPDAKHGTRAAALLAAAREAGIKTSIDLISEESDRYASVVRPALKHTDYFIVNEYEAGHTAGFKTRDAQGHLDTVALRHTAGALLQMGVRELVVIHFPEGAFARTRKGDDYWQSAVNLPAKQIVDTTGAGDAFCAGVLFGLHEEREIKASLELGVCLAAACLTGFTATGGIKSLDTVLALGRKHRFRPALEPED